MGDKSSRERSRKNDSDEDRSESGAPSSSASTSARDSSGHGAPEAIDRASGKACTSGSGAPIHRAATAGRVSGQTNDTRDPGGGYADYDPGPDRQVLSARYGLDVRGGQARKLQRLETEFGSDRVSRWADEGMPVETMGKPRDMQAFRARQDERPEEVPTDIERRNEASARRNAARNREDGPAGKTQVPDSVRDVVSSPGKSLDESVQREMESKMGGSFDDVQLHTGPKAAAAAESINARAFTVGNHVAFNKGEYNPDSASGKKVLAHELTHVRQQTDGRVSMLPQADAENPGGASPDDIEGESIQRLGAAMHVQPKLEVSSPDEPAEQEAERVAEQVVQMDDAGGTTKAGERVSVQQGDSGRTIQRATATASGDGSSTRSYSSNLVSFIKGHEAIPKTDNRWSYKIPTKAPENMDEKYEGSPGEPIPFENKVAPYNVYPDNPPATAEATIGWGHLMGDPTDTRGANKLREDGDLKQKYHLGITESDAEQLLKQDIIDRSQSVIKKWIETPQSQPQWDALVDFGFAAGVGNFDEHLTDIVNDPQSTPNDVAQAILGAKDGKQDDIREAEAVMYVYGRYDNEAKYTPPDSDGGGGSENEEDGGGSSTGGGGSSSNRETYTVESGDTLAGIASAHGIDDWKKIARWNNIDPQAYQNQEEYIHPGDELFVEPPVGEDSEVDVDPELFDAVKEAVEQGAETIEEAAEYAADVLEATVEEVETRIRAFESAFDFLFGESEESKEEGDSGDETDSKGYVTTSLSEGNFEYPGDIAAHYGMSFDELSEFNKNQDNSWNGDARSLGENQEVRVPVDGASSESDSASESGGADEESDEESESPGQSPTEQIEEKSEQWQNGDIKMPDLARGLKPFADSHGEEIVDVIYSLRWDNRDNLSYALANNSRDSELSSFETPLLETMASTLNTWLAKPTSWERNKEQRERVLQALGRDGEKDGEKGGEDGGGEGGGKGDGDEDKDGKVPSWHKQAEKEIGTEEGDERIKEYFDAVHTNYRLKDNGEPLDWCGIFMSWVMEQAGPGANYQYGPAAQNWYHRGWSGKEKNIPNKEEARKGLIVVFERGDVDDFKGHVGLVNDVERSGGTIDTWEVLGGNQDDSVCLKDYDRFIGYVLPKGGPDLSELPKL